MKRAAATFLGIEHSVFTVAAVSLIALGFAAARTDKMLAIAGAVIFAVRLHEFALFEAMPAQLVTLAVVRQSARLNAVTMAWGALALLIAYPVIGLKWQHGWQYGLGAALIAALFFVYALRLDKPDHPLAQPRALETARWLSALLVVAVTIAIAWLIASGKLLTFKNDWLANDVFLAIAASLLAVCVLTFVRARQP